MPPTQLPLQDRECDEWLLCPKCGSADLDFEFISYRLVRCYLCKSPVRVTSIRAFIGPPGDPLDRVLFEGEVATE